MRRIDRRLLGDSLSPAWAAIVLLAVASSAIASPAPAGGVVTSSVSTVTGTTATGGGSVTGYSSVTARGVCWNTSGTPSIAESHTTDGSGAGSFTSYLTDLTPATTYYVRAYAVNGGIAYYGQQVSFATATTALTVTTAAVTNVSATSATSGGEVTGTSGPSVTARGVCWSTTSNPTTANSKTVDGSGTGTFTSSVTGLTPSMTYYLRAYATTSSGTVYGNQVSFMASGVASSVSTAAISSITTSTAVSGGTVYYAGGQSVTARGVCWNTTGLPTTSDQHTTDGTGTGSFTSSLTGLTAGITYHVRAYGTSIAGTYYGDERDFITLAVHSVGFVAGDHGTLTGSLSQAVAHGGACTAVTAVPGTGYHFASWTGDYVGSANPLTITNVVANMTITANFAIDTHTVTFQAAPHGSVAGSGVETVEYGSDCAAVTAVPATGYHFASWTGDYVGSANPLTITNVVANMTITANFAIDTHTVTFQAAPHGSVAGSGVGTVEYGSDCAAVTAAPETGYHFVGWTGDYTGSENPLTVLGVIADMTITANFAVDAHTVTYRAGRYGSLAGPSIQTIEYGGDCVAVTAVPNAGFTFAGWTGDYVGKSNPLTVREVTGDLLITATYAAAPVVHTAPDLRLAVQVQAGSGNGGGSITTGQNVSVGVIVQNDGDAAATGVRLVVPLPENMGFVSAAVWDAGSSQPRPVEVSVDGKTAIVHIGEVAMGGRLRMELTARADASGTATFDVQAQSDQTPQDVEARSERISVEDEYLGTAQLPGLCGALGTVPLLALGAAFRIIPTTAGRRKRGPTCVPEV